MIYAILEDIDDVSRLANSCRRMYAIFTPLSHRLRILRSIIVGLGTDLHIE